LHDERFNTNHIKNTTTEVLSSITKMVKWLRLNGNSRPNYVLLTKLPICNGYPLQCLSILQTYRHLKHEKKDTDTNKNTVGALLISDKMEFRTKDITKNKHYFLMIKGVN
jgi:hypothetical protein